MNTPDQPQPGEGGGRDERRIDRRPCNLEALVFAVDGRGVPGEPVSGVLVDLSPAGAGVLTEAPPSEGARVLVLVSSARGKRLLFGRVCSASLWNSKLHRVGLELHRIPALEQVKTDLLDEAMLEMVERDGARPGR